jgi:hypothetical protein
MTRMHFTSLGELSGKLKQIHFYYHFQEGNGELMGHP